LASPVCDYAVLPVYNRRDISYRYFRGIACAMSPRRGLGWRKGGDKFPKNRFSTEQNFSIHFFLCPPVFVFPTPLGIHGAAGTVVQDRPSGIPAHLVVRHMTARALPDPPVESGPCMAPDGIHGRPKRHGFLKNRHGFEGILQSFPPENDIRVLHNSGARFRQGPSCRERYRPRESGHVPPSDCKGYDTVFRKTGTVSLKNPHRNDGERRQGIEQFGQVPAGPVIRSSIDSPDKNYLSARRIPCIQHEPSAGVGPGARISWGSQQNKKIKNKVLGNQGP
jgi:hypothetical protein